MASQFMLTDVDKCYCYVTSECQVAYDDVVYDVTLSWSMYNFHYKDISCVRNNLSIINY